MIDRDENFSPGIADCLNLALPEVTGKLGEVPREAAHDTQVQATRTRYRRAHSRA
jgi:hypothetical protein